jgi:hypothetical protein
VLANFTVPFIVRFCCLLIDHTICAPSLRFCSLLFDTSVVELRTNPKATAISRSNKQTSTQMFNAFRLRPAVAMAATSVACLASAANLASAHGESTEQQQLQQAVTQRDRARAAIVGAFVADAASMGLHWCVAMHSLHFLGLMCVICAVRGCRIYDQSKVDALVAFRRDVPAFFEPPSSPAYTYQSGSLSIYGHGLMPLLRSVADKHGLNSADLTEKYELRSVQIAELVARGNHLWVHCGLVYTMVPDEQPLGFVAVR